jgi:hypothetical protein
MFRVSESCAVEFVVLLTTLEVVFSVAIVVVSFTHLLISASMDSQSALTNSSGPEVGAVANPASVSSTVFSCSPAIIGSRDMLMVLWCFEYDKVFEEIGLSTRTSRYDEDWVLVERET